MILSHARLVRPSLQLTYLFVKPSIRVQAASSAADMKRKAIDTPAMPKAKRTRESLPDYCDVEGRRDGRGAIVWPAATEAIESARGFLREWCVEEKGRGVK